MILYIFGMVAVLMGCFFYTPEKVKAAEPQGAQISAQVQTVAYSSDIPEEVKKPIERGKNLVAYCVAALGFITLVIGFLMEVASWTSKRHENSGIIRNRSRCIAWKCRSNRSLAFELGACL